VSERRKKYFKRWFRKENLSVGTADNYAVGQRFRGGKLMVGITGGGKVIQVNSKEGKKEGMRHLLVPFGFGRVQP